MSSEPFEQLGKFIFKFQAIEAQINDLILLMAKADDN